MDCQTLLRYLRLKKQQLAQLRTLATTSTVLALNAFADIAPTIDALDEKSDYLMGRIVEACNGSASSDVAHCGQCVKALQHLLSFCRCLQRETMPSSVFIVVSR